MGKATASSKRAIAVLVVASDPVIGAALPAALWQLGCQPRLARSRRAALALLSRRGFDLALIDIAPPALEGLETARRIRALPGCGAQLPIAALTADAGPSLLDAIADAGMDAFVEKPVLAPRLAKTLALLAGSVQAAEGDQVQDEDHADEAGDQFHGEHGPLSPRPGAGQPTRGGPSLAAPHVLAQRTRRRNRLTSPARSAGPGSRT